METSTQIAIRYQSLISLKPNSKNPRTHSKKQVQQIADSIRRFGFANPIIVDRNNRIIAGHGRFLAAKSLGIESVPTITLEDLSEDEIRAYIIADNRLAERAGWDEDILKIELQHLATIQGLDFDVTITGFEIPEIDILIGESTQSASEPEVVSLPEADQPAVSQLGDVWRLGRHRIRCGDSLTEVSYDDLMGKDQAAVVFTDPPYNVKIDGYATGKGKIHHREFAMASGEMADAEFNAFLGSTLSLLAHYSAPQSVHYICMDWKHIATLLAAGKQTYDQLLNLCVWVKDNGGMGSFYRSQHELIAVFKKGKKAHLNNVQLGRFGRNRTNVWQYPGIQTSSKRSDEGNLLALHPTVKPTDMVVDALLDCTKRGDIVLDAFLGSGTTLMAAERIGRTCYGIEIDPFYIDTVIRRWQKCTGDEAIQVASNKTFAQVAAERNVISG